MALIKIKSADITRSLIRENDLPSIFLNIYSNSIILNLNFQIVFLGESVQLDLGYSGPELKNKNINVLANGLQDTLVHSLTKGYFEEQRFHLFTKYGEPLLVGLAGFYSGLFSDINGFIVLDFKNLEEVKSVYRKLEAKTEELDQFIYQASHNLRGPLATIKGLTRIVKTAQNNEEMMHIITQIAKFSDTLDERLHKLTFLAEADKEISSPTGKIDFLHLESKLKETIHQHSPDCAVNFIFAYQVSKSYRTNDILLTSLLTNLCSFLVSHPKEKNNFLQVDLFQDASSIEITVRLQGFSFSEETRKILADETQGYAELLKRPDLVYCYATHKIINKMRGGISFNFLSNQSQVVIIYVPNQE